VARFVIALPESALTPIANILTSSYRADEHHVHRHA
jgi:hypothetical protein